MFHIVQNHPFNDGNKRTGAGSAYLFLRINEAKIIFENTFEDETFEDFVVEVSKGKKTKKEIAHFLECGIS